MFDKLESFVGVIWSFLLAFTAAAQQLGEEPEEFIRFLQTKDGKILVPGMVEFVVFARRGNKPVKPLSQQLTEWKLFYKKFFRHQLDVESIRIPARQEGFDRLIVVAKGFTLNQIYAVMARHFDCWRYTENLDKAVTHNDRDANRDGSYAVWMPDRQEADEENKNQSARQRWQAKSQDVTLAEQMLYNVKFWDETGEHPDMHNWTMCSGSRAADGHVLDMLCSYGEVKVYWDNPGNSYGNFRARSVVSGELKASGA